MENENLARFTLRRDSAAAHQPKPVHARWLTSTSKWLSGSAANVLAEQLVASRRGEEMAAFRYDDASCLAAVHRLVL